MKKSYLSLKFEQLKEKFSNLFSIKKKVKALRNYLSVAPLEPLMARGIERHLCYIEGTMATDFIDEIENKYLDARIDQLNLDFLLWAHKTSWLKEQMSAMCKGKPEKQGFQLVLPLDGVKQYGGSYPTELVGLTASKQPSTSI